MFEFFPVRLRGVNIDLHALAIRDPDLAAKLGTNDEPYDPASEDHPFIQLSYNEINQDALNRILAYSDIVNSNRPLGLPFDFNPLVAPGTDGNEWHLYPLSGLDQHLHYENPSILAMLHEHKSLDALFDSLDDGGNDVTAEEYLVLTLTEAIRFCKCRGIGLATNW